MAKKQTKTPPPVAAAEPSHKKMDGGPDDYEAESAYSSLIRAQEHLDNPEIMERVKKHAGRKHKAISGLHSKLGLDKKKEEKQEIKSIDDIRKAAGKKAKTGMRAF